MKEFKDFKDSIGDFSTIQLNELIDVCKEIINIRESEHIIEDSNKMLEQFTDIYDSLSDNASYLCTLINDCYECPFHNFKYADLNIDFCPPLDEHGMRP